VNRTEQNLLKISEVVQARALTSTSPVDFDFKAISFHPHPERVGKLNILLTNEISGNTMKNVENLSNLIPN
jgi:hypothetical protein